MLEQNPGRIQVMDFISWPFLVPGGTKNLFQPRICLDSLKTKAVAPATLQRIVGRKQTDEKSNLQKLNFGRFPNENLDESLPDNKLNLAREKKN